MAEPSSPPSSGPRSDTLPSSFDSSPEFFEEKRWAKLSRKLRQEPLIPLGTAATIYALYQASKSIQTGDHHQTNRMFRARIYAQGFTLLALVGGSIYWKDDRMKRKEFEKLLEEKRAAEKKEKWLRELEQRDREDREWRGRFEDVATRAHEAEEAAKVGAAKARKKVDEAVGGVAADAKLTAAQRPRKMGEKAEALSEEIKEAARQGKDGMRLAKSRAMEDGKEAEGKVNAVAERVREGAKQGKQSVKEAIDDAFQSKSVLEQVEISGWGRGTWAVRETWRRI